MDINTYDPFRRGPDGRRVSDYRLADDRAISCIHGKETLFPFAEHIARIVTGDDSFAVDKVESQSEIGITIRGKRARLDLVIVGKGGALLDVEAQKYAEDDLIDRMTLYTSELMLRSIDAGGDYSELRDVYIVFLCRKDLLGSGVPVERIEMRGDGNRLVGAKFHWIVLSQKNNPSPKSELEWLSHDFFAESEEIHDRAMSERLQYLCSEEGLRMMFESREEELARKLAAKEREVTQRVREEDTDREIARDIAFGIDPERIAEALEVPLTRVLAVAEREGLNLKKAS